MATQIKDTAIYTANFWNSQGNQDLQSTYDPWTQNLVVWYEATAYSTDIGKIANSENLYLTHRKKYYKLIFLYKMRAYTYKLKFVNFYKVYSVRPVDLPSWNWYSLGGQIRFALNRFIF